MLDLGWIAVGATINIPWDSFAGTTGASSAASNYADADILVFKNGSVTQRSSAAGITATTTFDSRTGLNLATIDLSDNTDAGFYTANSEYLVAIDTVTIDSQTVRFWLARFYIGVRPVNVTQLLGTAWLTPGTAGTPDVNAKLWNALATVELPLVPTTAGRKLDVSAGGEAGVDWANVGSPTTTVGLSGTTVAVVTTYTGNTPQTGDSFARIGALGAGLTAVGGLGTGAIAAASFAAGAIDASAIAANAIGASELADGAIDAATFAANAIDAAALATDAVTEIVTAIGALAMVEPSAVPAATATLKATLSWILALSRNKVTQTATEQKVYQDDGSTLVATSTHSDDGTTHTRGEFA